MNQGLISRRYAKALFEYAAERGEDKALYGRMQLFMGSMSAQPHLRATLNSPVVNRKDKIALLLTAVGGDVEESLRRFVNLVVRNERESIFDYIALSYIEIYRRAHNIIVVTLISVAPMSDLVLERIRLDVERRTRGEVELDIRIDESLQGGFIFQIDDMRLDASVAGQLELIRRQFKSKNRALI